MHPNNALPSISATIIGVVYLAMLGGLFVFYEGDKVQASILLSGAVGIIYVQLASYSKSADNNQQLAKIDNRVAILDQKQEQNTKVTEETLHTVNGRMTEFKELMERYTAAQVAAANQTGLAAGIVIGQNTPVADPSAELALKAEADLKIDPSLKKVEKPILGDHH